ncbi:Non-specific lipid-transfer protein [Melia azedarach]|uniref:Non-specific lipid-transfer protein n=2 Tax=Melia azedarach TaxID=155640 RepID=A0ACC1WYY8_MELAZ|nr:Non-specific lipid-transfer protein [Melia azedarach]KAJ4704259.1 Non-specific lipid-transfer protein [Melia azedarach]
MAPNKSTCVVLLSICICMVLGAPIAQAAITCGQVTSTLAPCIPYLRSGGGAVPAPCCSGIKSLNAAATTTPDRQAVCNCVKSAASSINGINYSLASGLPGKCGVSIPYQISPTTDCSKVK